MEKISAPSHFTDREGGGFREWGAGAIEAQSLDLRNPKRVRINGEGVHSLHWFPGDARWDCINGWTESLTEFSEYVSPPEAPKAKPGKRKGR